MKKILSAIALLTTVCILNSQSLNLKIGVFNPSLSSDLWTINLENLAFAKSDLRNIFYAAEYEFFLDRHISFSIEIGSYSRIIYSQYRDYEFEDGSPIEQNLSLSITPIEANVKFYPLGHRSNLNPFIGAGFGLYQWEYEQWGDFINFNTMDVNYGNAITDTYSLGFNLRAGMVIRFNRFLGFSLEGRYQYLKGELSGFFEDFEKLDMSGLTGVIGLNIFLR